MDFSPIISGWHPGWVPLLPPKIFRSHASAILAEFNPLQRNSMKQSVWAALITGGVLMSCLPAIAQTRTQRGEYLVTIMDCSGCHTPGTFLGKPDMQRPLAGSEVGFQIPGLGIFYPPNLTPDPE